MAKLGLATILLAILLAACGGSLRGNASAGPNPGGGRVLWRPEHRHWTDQSLQRWPLTLSGSVSESSAGADNRYLVNYSVPLLR
jgi:hypothetical protein